MHRHNTHSMNTLIQLWYLVKCAQEQELKNPALKSPEIPDPPKQPIAAQPIAAQPVQPNQPVAQANNPSETLMNFQKTKEQADASSNMGTPPFYAAFTPIVKSLAEAGVPRWKLGTMAKRLAYQALGFPPNTRLSPNEQAALNYLAFGTAPFIS